MESNLRQSTTKLLTDNQKRILMGFFKDKLTRDEYRSMRAALYSDNMLAVEALATEIGKRMNAENDILNRN